MKNGSVLIESIVFLLLSFMLFLMVAAGIERLTRRENFIEMGTQDLTFLISISNVLSDFKDMPLDLEREMITHQSTDGRIWYEYPFKSSKRRIFLPLEIGYNSSRTSYFNGDILDRFDDSL